MFTHLHIHSEYSLLDGMCRIPLLVKRAKELGMDSLAITDHGVMYGVIQFYQAAKDAGIKPIIGCEVYIAPDSRHNRGVSDKGHCHLILLAKNQTGYRNLLQLTTRAHLEGFYYRPRLDRELLREYNQGLVALTSCIAGEVPRLILEGRAQEARESALWYKQTFEDFYLEIQRQPMPELEMINKGLIAISNDLDIPLVATNDVHYINKEDAQTHDLLLCVGTNTTVQDEKRMKMAGDYFYLKSPQEMAEIYKDIPQALENAERIAAMCNLKLDFGRLHLPEIELPKEKTPDEFLADLCHEGLKKQYPQLTPDIEKRLEYELDVIKQTQFANYFLVVWDIISFVKKQGILYGVRGSAAASIALHCLGITDIDPLKYKLVFERFLNIERREMPDIDLDFQDDRRDEVIRYVSQKYGRDHVAQIITFGTLGARAAIRDVGRALGMTYGDVDRVARLIPFAVNMTLDRALEENAEMRAIYQEDTLIRKLIDAAKKVEGISRHASTHAAGVVISKQPLTNYVPLQKASKGGGDESTTMTQFSMDDIAKIGLLKMDFLGLANLTILGLAKKIIRQNRDVDIDLHKIPLDNKKTYELLSSGETAGVFQLEGVGMRRYIKDLKPTTFSDIAAMVALYRPGPMEHIPTFIKAKHGEEEIRYPHPALASILEETYGVIVYQEQVLFIVQTLAGYTLGQADIFRKAMGKKIVDVMKKQKEVFMAGAKKNGFSQETAEAVFALIEPFAGYAFNKAHATSYALIAYQTAYLKANYPVEYMTALLSSNVDVQEKIASAVGECRRLGLPVLPPDINRSQVNFSIEKTEKGSAIRFGLIAIKNVGQGAVEPLIAEREKNGPFKSIEDLCRRADLHGANKRVMESLIKAGALDSLGERGTLLRNIDRILSLAQKEHRMRDTGQSTMFDLFGEVTPAPLPSLEMEAAEVSVRDKLAWEKELTGVWLSEHAAGILPVAGNAETTLCGQIDSSMEGQSVVMVGMVVSARQLFTRDKEKRAFVSAVLEDISGQIEVMAWPKVYNGTQELWHDGNVLEVKGKVKMRDDQVQLGCESVSRYQPEKAQDKEAKSSKLTEPSSAKANHVPPAKNQRLILSIVQSEDEETDVKYLNKLVGILKKFPGKDEVSLRVTSEEKVVKLKLSNVYIGYCPELHQQLVAMVGEDGISLEEIG